MSTYLIELTDGFMNDKGEFLYRAVGCNTLVFDENGINNILHPIDIPELKEESRKEGYHQGFKDGKNQAVTELPELANHENEIYDKGYQQALKDYNMLIECQHDCAPDCSEFLHKVFGLSELHYGINLLYVLIKSYDMAQVINEFQKWLEKKKIKDEIKVGDYVKDMANDRIGIVLSAGKGKFIYLTEDNGVYLNNLGSLEKLDKNVADKIQALFS